MGKVFALYLGNLGSIPNTQMDTSWPWSQEKINFQHFWVWPKDQPKKISPKTPTKRAVNLV